MELTEEEQKKREMERKASKNHQKYEKNKTSKEREKEVIEIIQNDVEQHEIEEETIKNSPQFESLMASYILNHSSQPETHNETPSARQLHRDDSNIAFLNQILSVSHPLLYSKLSDDFSMGIGLFAKEDIPPGHLFTSLPSFSASLHPVFQSPRPSDPSLQSHSSPSHPSACSFCLSENDNNFVCEHCGIEHYCSQTCKEKG